MRHSFLYLGTDKTYENALQADSPCRLSELHWFAQRVCQYARASDLDRSAVAKLIPRLTARVGSHFFGQATLAVAHHLLGELMLAEAAWQRAAEQAPDDHPWRHVVSHGPPWAEAARPQRLVEEQVGRVYCAVGETRAAGAAFGAIGVARFIRLADGQLVLVNPVHLSQSVVDEVNALGVVAHIIAPAKYHSEHVMTARRHFPGAKAWGVPGHRGYLGVADVRFDGYLDDEAPLFPGEIDQVTLDGNDVGDVWLLDRASSTLMVTDALFFAAERQEPEFSHVWADFYAWAWGVCGRNGVPSYQPPMWRDLRSFQSSLRKAFTLDFDRVAYSHGSWRVIPDNGRARLEEALAWILELRAWDSLRLTLDFTRRHPAVVYRALKSG